MSESNAIKRVVSNRKARFEYYIEDRYEAGLSLVGTEVKSLRDGKANLQDAYVAFPDGRPVLMNAHISPYTHGTHFNHDPLRPRPLLLKKREIQKLLKATEQKGYTVVPLSLYFKNGYAKIEIGTARGKKLYDKRDTIADRESKRRLDRVMKGG